jgi:hypothetical protein
MAEIVIPEKNWDRIKIKIQRKYNHLREEDLQYSQGGENELILKLQDLTHQNRDYIVFMLRKMQHNLDTNLL